MRYSLLQLWVGAESAAKGGISILANHLLVKPIFLDKNASPSKVYFTRLQAAVKQDFHQTGISIQNPKSKIQNSIERVASVLP
jgi:hypothetical protein